MAHPLVNYWHLSELRLDFDDGLKWKRLRPEARTRREARVG